MIISIVVTLLDDIRPNDGWQELGDPTASVLPKLISSNPFQDGFDTNTGALGSSGNKQSAYHRQHCKPVKIERKQPN